MTQPPNPASQQPRTAAHVLAAYAVGERNFARWNLAGADLKGATLKDANFFRANLTKADLSGSDLTRCNFSQATLTTANLHGANISQAYFDGAVTFGADLTDVITDRPTSRETTQNAASAAATPAIQPTATTPAAAPAAAPAARFCAFCGANMPAAGSFCAVCGKQQPTVTPATQSPTPQMPVVQPRPAMPSTASAQFMVPSTPQQQRPPSAVTTNNPEKARRLITWSWIFTGVLGGLISIRLIGDAFTTTQQFDYTTGTYITGSAPVGLVLLIPVAIYGAWALFWGWIPVWGVWQNFLRTIGCLIAPALLFAALFLIMGAIALVYGALGGGYAQYTQTKRLAQGYS